MKKYISTMEVFAGLTYKRMAAVLGSMAALELLLFWIFGLSRKVYTFENAVKGSYIMVVFGIAFAAMFWVLAWTSGKSSQYVYTLQRLKMSERAAVRVQFLYYILCFALFVLTQTVLLLLMAKLFENGSYYTEGPQGIFVDLRMNHFLFRLLPQWDRVPLLINALSVIYSAGAAVNMNVKLRHGKAPVFAVILAAAVGLSWAYFGRPDFLSTNGIFALGSLLLLFGFAINGALGTARMGRNVENGPIE